MSTFLKTIFQSKNLYFDHSTQNYAKFFDCLLIQLRHLIFFFILNNLFFVKKKNKNEIFHLEQQKNELQAIDMKKLRLNKSYVYRSYSEVLALVSITLLKDLLVVQTNNS